MLCLYVCRASDDPLQEKANQVTLALRKTTELMRAELDQSVMASQLLGASPTLPRLAPSSPQSSSG